MKIALHMIDAHFCEKTVKKKFVIPTFHPFKPDPLPVIVSISVCSASLPVNGPSHPHLAFLNAQDILCMKRA